LQLIVAQFHSDEIDASDLLIERNRAAVEVPTRYRHRETGAPFESTKSNFWSLEDGWPVKLTEYHAIAARSGLRQRRRRRPPGMTGMKKAPYRPPCSAASSSGVG